MTKNIEELDTQIETLVREHIAACHRAAAAAVDRAFGSAPKRAKSGRRATPRAGSERRSAEEMAEVGERLYKAVVANPGECMMVLMKAVGASTRELREPMKRLKRAGRIRSVGQRREMRYFPMIESS